MRPQRRVHSTPRPRIRTLPPKRIDVEWRELAWAVAACVRPPPHRRSLSNVEGHWPGGISCLSVRSAFDLLLRALALPPGDEVIVSAVTIPDMATILVHHGLVPVPVDIDARSLAPRIADLESVLSERTRAVLVAHLFGSRAPLDDVVAFARRHDLLLIEDAAQAYVGPGSVPHPATDVTMFSFGIIKTATAFGGGVLVARDPALIRRIRELRDALPMQSRRSYLFRVIRSGALRAFSSPLAFGLALSVLRWTGTDPDELLSRGTRGVSGPDLLGAIRQRPAAPLVAFLDRRLRGYDSRSVAIRASIGCAIADALPAGIMTVGDRADEPTYWVFPVVVPDTHRVRDALRAAGFHAMAGTTSLAVVEPPTGRPDPRAARQMLNQIVYLPLDGATGPDLSRMLRVLRSVTEGSAAPVAAAGWSGVTR